MSSDSQTTCTVVRNGNSEMVTLPATWRKSAGVKAGDKLVVTHTDTNTITFAKADENRSRQIEAFDRLIKHIEDAPVVPWDDDSKESDRTLLENRYV